MNSLRIPVVVPTVVTVFSMMLPFVIASVMCQGDAVYLCMAAMAMLPFGIVVSFMTWLLWLWLR